MQDDPSTVSRRALLGSAAGFVATASLAGCTSIWSQPGASDVVLHNMAPEPTTVTVRIRAADRDETRTDRRLEVPAGGTVDPVNRGKLPLTVGYVITVEVEDGAQETFEWTDPNVSLAPIHVLVDGSENVTFLLQAG